MRDRTGRTRPAAQARGWVAALCAVFIAGSAAANPVVIPLYSGPAPGSEQTTQPEVTTTTGGGRIIRNVTAPSLTVFAPAAGTATGVAAIVAPGGGFQMLSIDSEGT